jgi:serine acetyltransferase
VVNDVPAHSVVGGVPARILRGINGEDIRKYSQVYFSTKAVQDEKEL